MAAENWTGGLIPLFHLIRVIPAEGSVFQTDRRSKGEGDSRLRFFYEKSVAVPADKKKGEKRMKTKKMAVSAMFIAVGVLAGNVIYIPVGASKCFPIQHTLNVLAAVFLGPFYGVVNAFCISLLRNLLGTGSIMAFPGSMVGALLAGIIYRMTKNQWATATAEVLGTGVLGGLLAVPLSLIHI